MYILVSAAVDADLKVLGFGKSCWKRIETRLSEKPVGWM